MKTTDQLRPVTAGELTNVSGGLIRVRPGSLLDRLLHALKIPHAHTRPSPWPIIIR